MNRWRYRKNLKVSPIGKSGSLGSAGLALPKQQQQQNQNIPTTSQSRILWCWHALDSSADTRKTMPTLTQTFQLSKQTLNPDFSYLVLESIFLEKKWKELPKKRQLLVLLLLNTEIPPMQQWVRVSAVESCCGAITTVLHLNQPFLALYCWKKPDSQCFWRDESTTSGNAGAMHVFVKCAHFHTAEYQTGFCVQLRHGQKECIRFFPSHDQKWFSSMISRLFIFSKSPMVCL